MIHKTRGIVFRFTKFRDTSIIVTIFTDQFGIRSYIVNGVRSKSGKNKIALYQPLTLLNLVVYHRENANIERIKEIECYHPYSTLLSDMRKAAIGMFINELLNKTVREETHVSDIFDFISGSLVTLDEMKLGSENFHLLFMLKLARYLGFGVRHAHEVIGGNEAGNDTVEGLEALLSADYPDPLKLSNLQRRNITDLLVKFYCEHIESIREIKSLQVLREVLS